MCDDLQQAVRLDVSNFPLSITLTRIGNHFLVDTTLEEELCTSARLAVGVTAAGRVVSAKKGGRGGIQPTALQEVRYNLSECFCDVVCFSYDLFRTRDR